MHPAAVRIHSALIGSCRCSAPAPMALAPPTASKIPEIFFSMALYPLGAQPPQRVGIACENRVTIVMPPVTHDLDAGAPHAVDDAAATGKDPAVQDLIVAPFEERRVAAREADHVERRPRGEPRRTHLPGRAALQHLPATLECSVEQTAPG